MFLMYFLFVLKQIREGHDYYFFPFLPILITLLVVPFFKFKDLHWVLKVALIASLIVLPFNSWNKVHDMWDIKYGYLNHDFFHYRQELRSVVNSDELCIMVNDFSNYIVPYTIDKMGYIFRKDNLPVNWIEDLAQNKGVKYMYSDSRKVENQEGFDELVERKLLSVGSINVFKLK